jgi:hypothetical protein
MFAPRQLFAWWWMAVVMARKRVRSLTPILPPPRSHLRAIETFSKRVSVGMSVIGEASKSKKVAVAKITKKSGLSERYVWGTVKLGSKMYAAVLAILEKEASHNNHSRPRMVAALFLLNALRNEPKSMKEIEALARKSHIAVSTLRRACKSLGVQKRRIGGQHGHWSWELPQEVKKSFGIDP